MPKRAIIRRTNSVKGGPRRHGGGTRNNGWNCMVVALLAVLLPIAGCAGAIGEAALLVGCVLAIAGVCAIAAAADVGAGRRRP